MLKNKIIGRKIRNIVILLMALIIMIGAYRYIDRSLAEKVIDLDAIALDNYGYLANERFVLQAKQIEEDLYEVELPESINTKKINQIVKVTLEEIVPEVTTESGVKENATTAIENTTEDSATTEPQTEQQTENATEENTIQENSVVEENTTPEEIVTEVPIEENTTQEETVTETPVEENITPDDTITENVTEEPVILEIVENRIYLTREQIENKQIKIEVEYDIAILEKNEEGNYDKTLLIEKTEEERKTLEDAGVIGTVETEESTQERETLYNKVLKYEDEKNGKLVELKGFLPIDAELQVEELSKSQIKEIFGDAEIDVAYDITILKKVIKYVPIDETNPESEMKEIVETIEINPEEYDEKCEVLIQDKKIEEDSQVIHVKEDNTFEKMEIKENTDGNVSFEAQKFSVYAVTRAADDGIATVADLPSSSTTTPYLPTGYSQVSGTSLSSGLVIEDSKGNQFVWIEVPRSTSVYSSTVLNYNLDTLTGTALTNAYNQIESSWQSYASAYRASGFEDTYSSDLSTVMTSSQYTELKQKMIKSVFINGGFWIGRYETGITSARTAYSSSTPATSATVIKQHVYPCNYIDIKQAQTISARFAPTGYTGSLMFGIQWDLMLRYLQAKGTSVEQLTLNSIDWGNIRNSATNIESGAKYSPPTDPADAATIGVKWYPTPFNKTAEDRILLTTGAHSSYFKQNISDVAGNLHEYTLERSQETGLNVVRGSYHGSNNNPESDTGRLGTWGF